MIDRVSTSGKKVGGLRGAQCANRLAAILLLSPRAMIFKDPSAGGR
jgi:hypothetical protein